MMIIRHPDIEKDIKNLKRFPAARESLEAWERLFSLKGLKEMPGIELYQGLGLNKIFKARIIPLKENIGKSSGYRLVFREIDKAKDEYELLIFSRHDICKTERELREIIKNRI